MATVSGTIETFARDIKIATQDLSPEAVAASLAGMAKEALAEAVASGEGSPVYERYVNGVRGAAEETVIPPGPIIYVFLHWPTIIATALEELRKRVPVRSGRYARGFIVLANGRIVQRYDEIDGEAEVLIFNVEPYTRKMEVGANKTGARHFEKARGAVQRQFKNVARCEVSYLDIQTGVAPGVPWILRRNAGRRKDRRSGMPISYPALVINLE
ncbi:hypothetical protein [Hyphomicrobium sp. ghe19]|uniref:hypothetical protein n=1 Tax=Hyphomicrobium sp. ghe19 TaxID=2682968 RepID=UPI0013670723|nr:hypothetical protein HYPP_03770 [Hyphomicrobium sp. ghe19]